MLTEEKVEAIKRLTLEHELEMVAMKEKWEEEDSSRQGELSSLSEVIFHFYSVNGLWTSARRYSICFCWL